MILNWTLPSIGNELKATDFRFDMYQKKHITKAAHETYEDYKHRSDKLLKLLVLEKLHKRDRVGI